jgi:small basic protein (TIGR04137 family)
MFIPTSRKTLANRKNIDIFRPPKFSTLSNTMSQHPSLKLSGGSVGAKRSVLKRFERVKLMKKRGQWKDGQSAIGLPKTLPEL